MYNTMLSLFVNHLETLCLHPTAQAAILRALMDLVLFGIQGSGKGTQAKRLAAEMGYSIFETGAELRRIAASGTELGAIVASYIDHGHLAPLEIVIQAVREGVTSRPQDQKILFDGFPRDIDQSKQFDVMMKELGRDFTCIRLTMDEEEALKRVQQRAQEQGRADDASEEFIRRRMAIFHEKTEPVIAEYTKQGRVIDVNGEGSVDDVYERIKKALSVA
jgi:adenylate kinase